MASKSECLYHSDGSRGLLVRSPWAELILDGKKTWEIRGKRTQTRGRIAIIQSGTKKIFGYCDLIDVEVPLTLSDLLANVQKHFIPREQLLIDSLPYPKMYAWALDRPRWLRSPLPYYHPPGAVIWVSLALAGQYARTGGAPPGVFQSASEIP